MSVEKPPLALCQAAAAASRSSQLEGGLEETHTSKRDARLKRGEKNLAARLQTFAKTPDTAVCLQKAEAVAGS